MKQYTVCIEWPTGSEDVEFEVEDDATEKDIDSAAADIFFNLCNYGVRVADDR